MVRLEEPGDETGWTVMDDGTWAGRLKKLARRMKQDGLRRARRKRFQNPWLRYRGDERFPVLRRVLQAEPRRAPRGGMATGRCERVAGMGLWPAPGGPAADQQRRRVEGTARGLEPSRRRAIRSGSDPRG